jgi:hypothetical protein
MRNRSNLKSVPEIAASPDLKHAFDRIELSAQPLPLIPAGPGYEVVVIGCRRTERFGRPLLDFSFRIVSQGEHFDWVIPTMVNFPGRQRRVPPRSKIAAWLRIIQKFDPAININKVSISIFGKYQFLATVETVIKDYNNRPLPEHEQYSKIGDLTEVIGRIKS